MKMHVAIFGSVADGSHLGFQNGRCFATIFRLVSFNESILPQF